MDCGRRRHSKSRSVRNSTIDIWRRKIAGAGVGETSEAAAVVEEGGTAGE